MYITTKKPFTVSVHRQSSGFFTIVADFDRPVTIDEQARKVTAVEVKRDAVCGCAHFTAEGLVGISIDEAEEKAGLLHHHYPCMASMGIDSDFNDTLMHISGNIMKESVTRQVKPYKRYITPGQRSE